MKSKMNGASRIHSFGSATKATGGTSEGKKTSTSNYPRLSELPPLGSSMLFAVWKLDPSSTGRKSLSLGLTLICLIGLWFATDIISWLFPTSVDASWDERQGIISSLDSPSKISSGSGLDVVTTLTLLPLLMEKGLEISEEAVRYCFLITALIFVGMIVADAALGMIGNDSRCPWPKSWSPNPKLYDEQFLEPARIQRLLKRPGSVLSNAPFLLGSLCVLAAVATSLTSTNYKNNHILWLADLQFGLMLFALAASSCLWHGSNAPWTRYPDHLSMDCSILYLIVRSICLGVLAVLVNHCGVPPGVAKGLAGTACAGIYGRLVYSSYKQNLLKYQHRYLHGPTCPFSVRARLSGTSNMFGMGQKDFRISHVAFFAALPFLYTLIPILIQIFLLKTRGSVLAGNLCAQTLIVGWTYRLSERFALDGNVIMNYILRQQPSRLRTIGAAVFAPTASLHFFCGITLVAGYIQARSLESDVWAVMNE